MDKIYKSGGPINDMENRPVKIKAHGTAYVINKYGRLAGCPILTNGKIDKSEFEIEQSPLSFKAGHKKALKKLGVNKRLVSGIIKHIHYH